MTKVILFNAPPRAGKDTAGQTVLSRFRGAQVKFSDPVKHGTHNAYGIYGVSADHFEAVKDEPLEEFFGLTPREAYIDFSERYMKPKHGKDVFGRIATNVIARLNELLITIPDSGFYHEAMPVVRYVGPENVLLIRIHSIVNGKTLTFAGDSRSYIELPGVRTIDVANLHLEDFVIRIRAIAQEWLGDDFPAAT